MKHSPKYILLALVTLFSNAQAATISDIQMGVQAYANQIVSSSENFYDQDFNGDITSPYISPDALKTAVADGNGNLETYAWTNVAHETDSNNGYISLNFGTNIYTGEGADLVLFFAGNGTPFKNGTYEEFLFSVAVGTDDYLDGGLMGVTDSTSFYNSSGVLTDLPAGITPDTLTQEQKDMYDISMFASYAMIDLDAFGYDQTTALGDIRVYLGDSSMPALAAVGAYHTSAVPLPLSSVLFGSGLALLGWISRRKSV